jgi:hypothetical protein
MVFYDDKLGLAGVQDFDFIPPEKSKLDSEQ